MNTLNALALCFELVTTSSTGVESRIVVDGLSETHIVAHFPKAKAIETNDSFWSVSFDEGDDIIVEMPFSKF